MLQKIGKVAYELDLPPTANIHPVFHISQLKKVINADIPIQPIPLVITDKFEWVVEPEDLLQIREGASGMEVLIKWKNLPDFEATWEPAAMVEAQFPEFHLGDNVKQKGGSIDRNPSPVIPYNRVYSRRKGPRKD